MRFIALVGLLASIYILIQVRSCAPEDINKNYSQIKSGFYLKEDIFEQIVEKVKADDYPISYLSPSSVKLANTMKARQTSQQTIDWYRAQMIKLGVEIAIQMSARNEGVSFAMWSQGIVPAGEAIDIKFTPHSIYEQEYYKRRNKKGTMSCETLKEDWYICKHS